MQPLIQLEKIVKHYGAVHALRGVSFNTYDGVTGLLGPNGAGKSTLIKVLLGLVKVTGGSGTILGYSLGQAGRKIREKVGYMPEDDCYIPGLSGIEVVRFSASLAGLPRVEGLRRAHEILDFCGMQQERYRFIETYSTGMRQKIKFACALVHDPELLILDEPTSGLDPEEREALLNRIRVLARDFGKTVILSTHILPDVQSTCQQVVILSQGNLIVNDSLENLNRPSSPVIIIQVLRNAASLAENLNRSGIPSESKSTMEIQATGILAQDSETIWKAAKQADAPIRMMHPGKNSLEQIFVNAIREAEHADA